MTEGTALKEFIYRLQEWRWPEALRALQSDVLFVTDAEIAVGLTEEYGPFNFHFSSPLDYESQLDDSINKLIFLCRTGERRQVKAARARFSDIEVYSATYDLAPVSLAGGGYFEWSLGEVNTDARAPVVMIAPPGSDADYLRHIFAENGVVSAQEYLNRTMAAWARLQTDFEVFRFLDGVARKHGQRRLELVIYTDVLFEIFEQTKLTLWRFGNLLKEQGVKIIYLYRRDKSVQSSLLCQLSDELGRSFWSRDHLAQPSISDKEPSALDLDQWLLSSMKAEAQLEPMLGRMNKYKNLTLEEVVESPQEVVEAVAGFLGDDAPSEANWPDYAKPYKKRPNLLSSAADLKASLIKRHGLMMNKYGSYTAGNSQE